MSKISKWYHKKWEELRKQFGGKCNICNSIDKIFQFAHVKPTKLSGRGRGRQQRYYDIKKNPKCYRLLCKDCHRELDRTCKEPDKVKTWKELKRKYSQEEIPKNA